MERKIKKTCEEQICVGMLTDVHLSTYQVFKSDTNYTGTEVSKYSKTESWKRAKCSSSSYYCASRRNKLDNLWDSIHTKEAGKKRQYPQE